MPRPRQIELRRTELRRVVLPGALAVAAIAALLFVADAVREHDGVAARVDPHVAADAVGVRTGPLTHLATLLTALGSEVVIGSLAALLMVVVLQCRGAFLAGCVAATMAVSVALTVGGKLVVERARPGAHFRIGPADASYSFPSGHTLNSAVFLGLLALLLVPLVPARSQRIAARAVAVLLAVGIGLSRLYLGYHWATDIAASWLLAIALLAVVRVAIRLWDPTAHARSRSGGSQVGAPSVMP